MDSFISTYAKENWNIGPFELDVQTDGIQNHIFIVLDDDPTGTQTIYDIPVYTNWKENTLEKLFEEPYPMAFLLTNSRAYPEERAIEISREIARTVKKISQKKKRAFTLVSRGDSTLRGHFPAEVDILLKELGIPDAIRFLVPAFFPGGRYTYLNTHWVKEGEKLIPVAETPFAKDKSFGFRSSNLLEWIQEKYHNTFPEEKIFSISLEMLHGTKKNLIDFLFQLPKGSIVAVNALEDNDLKAFVHAVNSSKRVAFYRTAASLIPILIQQKEKQLLGKEEFSNGGKTLVVVGSYVPKTTSQLQYLRNKVKDLIEIEVDVQLLLEQKEIYLPELKASFLKATKASNNLLLFTSRKLLSKNGQAENLQIGHEISDVLVQLTRLAPQPVQIIAKGGITSSDLATKALEIERAMVLGQILPGIPVWKLENGGKYIVFPGNVGEEDALYLAYKKLNP